MALVLDGTTGIVSANIADGTISASDLASGAITSAALPAGSVIQVVSTGISSSFSSNSTSYLHATNHSLSITTSVANSKILLFCNTPLQHPSSPQVSKACFKSSVDSYSAALGETVHANYPESSSGWKQSGSLQYLHQPNQSAGTTITYRVYIRSDSGNSIYFPDKWGRAVEFSFVAMEIVA